MANNDTMYTVPISDTFSNSTNGTDSSGPHNNDHITILAVLPVLLPLLAVIIVFICAKAILRGVSRKEAFERALQDPTKRLEHLEELVGHEKFKSWRVRQKGEMQHPTAFPTEYTCAICLSSISDSEHVRGLPCDHCFHQQCIDDWFQRQHDICPLCKRNFFTTTPGSRKSSFRSSRHSSWLPGVMV